jgi:hypothetical protein
VDLDVTRQLIEALDQEKGIEGNPILIQQEESGFER